jgi:ubiquinone biosynthesis accessory factor UbiJ
MFVKPSVASMNHLLRGSPWALERLMPHAGKSIAVQFGPIPLRYTIGPTGELSSAGKEAAADVTIEMNPTLLMRVASEGRSAFSEASISGDTALAQTLAYIAQNLSWDYEEDLSKVVGDVAAFRIGSTLRNVGDWAKQSTESFLTMSKDFWTEERPTIAKRPDLEKFVSDIDELRDAAARLEKRLEILTIKKKNAPPPLS